MVGSSRYDGVLVDSNVLLIGARNYMARAMYANTWLCIWQSLFIAHSIADELT